MQALLHKILRNFSHFPKIATTCRFPRLCFAAVFLKKIKPFRARSGGIERFFGGNLTLRAAPNAPYMLWKGGGRVPLEKHPRTVLLYGPKEESSLTLPLCRALEGLGGVLYLGPEGIAAYGEAPRRFLLLETDGLLGCDLPAPLLVLKPGADEPSRFHAPEGTIVLANKSAPLPPEPAGLLAPRPPACWLACECGEQSVLAISSLREESAVVELRQSLAMPGGGVLEPGEYPMQLPAPMEGYTLLCHCAATLLYAPTIT
jgi:hypothetical protein